LKYFKRVSFKKNESDDFYRTISISISITLHLMFFYRKDPKLSDTENILKYMRKNPNKGYLVSDLIFVGYKAGTRITDLCRK